MAEPRYTPGPWAWFGNTKAKSLHLCTVDRGRIYVMGFQRWGMSSAQPTFQKDHVIVPASQMVTLEAPYRHDVAGIDHPDARLISAAPELFEALRAIVKWADGPQPRNVIEVLLEQARQTIAKAEGRAPGPERSKP